MKKLELKQMENLEGGISNGCGWAMFNFALGIGSVCALTVTTGLGGVLLAAGGGLSGAIGMSACHGELF